MTEFRQDKAIYMQLADRLCDEIITGKYSADGRIPSVRESATIFEVNTNTVVKTYDYLSAAGIIYTKRGLGYFVDADAHDKIMAVRREKFFKDSVPEMFRQMRLLGVSINEIDDMWNKDEK